VTDQTQSAPQQSRQLILDEPVTGIVLAGGQSKRMGADKAWLPLAGRPLIEWVLSALRGVCQQQMVVGREVGRLGELGVPVVVDRMAIRSPLTGIHAGLKASSTDLNLVVACDVPLVRSELLSFLARAIGPTHAAVPYLAEGPPPLRSEATTAREAGLQPLCAAYRRSCIVQLEKLLLSGGYPTVALTSVVKARIVGPEEWSLFDPEGHSFFNINTPQDLLAAARIITSPEAGSV
jgi:molybdopterin-guanine dinucleotide biosynthesis protein A